MEQREVVESVTKTIGSLALAYPYLRRLQLAESIGMLVTAGKERQVATGAVMETLVLNRLAPRPAPISKPGSARPCSYADPLQVPRARRAPLAILPSETLNCSRFPLRACGASRYIPPVPSRHDGSHEYAHTRRSTRSSLGWPKGHPGHRAGPRARVTVP